MRLGYGQSDNAPLKFPKSSSTSFCIKLLEEMPLFNNVTGWERYKTFAGKQKFSLVNTRDFKEDKNFSQ